jgi:glucosamine-6-phosphate deaminase
MMRSGADTTSPEADGGAGLPSATPVHARRVGELEVTVHPSAAALGAASASDYARLLKAALLERAEVGVIFAAANSQLPFLQAVRSRTDLEWDRVHVFHMDEYLGMPDHHPASFRGFVQRELVDRVRPLAFHRLEGDAADPAAEIDRYSELLGRINPEICVLGIGENGHLAFNDPPADFELSDLVHEVVLDHACRVQQWQEGHFPTLEAVPSHALSLSVKALIRPGHLLTIVPGPRKAAAVRAALEGPVTPDCPASILRDVPGAHLYLDLDSSSLLSGDR